MKINPRLPKGKAKIILGLAFILILALTYIFFVNSKSHVLPQNTFELIYKKNKFSFSSNLILKDQKNLDIFLNQLGIPKNIVNGFEFELDSTSTAKLAFSSPINGKFDISEHTLQFNGSTNHQLVDGEFFPNNFKIPKSVQTSIFGSNLHPFVLSRLNITPDLNKWLGDNLFRENPEYLLVFNNGDIALFCQNKNPDFESLKQIGQKDNSLKEESEEDVVYYLYKLPKDKYGQEDSLSIFNVGEFTSLVSNQRSAKEIVKAIKTQEASQNFTDTNDKIAFYLRFQNKDQNLDENVKFALFGEKSLTEQKQKIFNSISKISELEITLKANGFSGLINW